MAETDAHADKLSKETGNPTTRADVIRTALTQWLREQKK